MSVLSVEPAVAEHVEAVREVAREDAAARERRWHWILLWAIFVVGVVLRFTFMERPLLWGDDAYTVYRTHADYQSMLNILQNDGFTPLHYQLYWVLGKWKMLTPTTVRLLPAIFGAAMPLAMYLLAVHLLRPRVALVVALFSACSAYLLGYSRDGKMYMMLWMFSALSAGTLLWWFKSRTRIAWLSWVASSLAMSSAHMPGVGLLVLEVIFFLTRKKVHWKESILFLIGATMIAAAPAGYINLFNAWAQDQVEDFGFEVEGLGWVVPYNQGRDGADLVRYTASAYLMSWEWPVAMSGALNDERLTPPWVLSCLKGATGLLLLLAVVGAMPWSRRLRGIKEGESAPEPWWRVMLWIGLWLILPVYFLYCRSMVDFISPKDWWREISLGLAGKTWLTKEGEVSAWFWFWVMSIAAVIGVGVFMSWWFRRLLVWLVPAVGTVVLIVCLLQMGRPAEKMLGGDWAVYLWRPLVAWGDWMGASTALLAMTVVLPGLIVFYCGQTWHDRVKRIAQFLAVLVVLVAGCALVHKVASDKLAKEMAQVMERNPSISEARAKATLTQANQPWQSIFMPRYIGFVWVAFCIALVALFMRLPTRGLRIAAVVLLIGVNLGQFGARIFAGTEPPLDRMARDLWTHHAAKRDNPKVDPSGVVFVNASEAQAMTGHPGNGTLYGQQGKYYLGLVRAVNTKDAKDEKDRKGWIPPMQWRQFDLTDWFDINYIGSGGGGRRRPPRDGGSSFSPSVLASNPAIKRIIVWDKIDDTPWTGSAGDANRRAAASAAELEGWTKTVEDYRVRFHWTWKDLYTYRRVEYVRK